MDVRDATPDDAAAWVRVERSAAPYLVVSTPLLLDDLASPHRLGHAVAEHDRSVLGVARIGNPCDGSVSLKILVHPDRRGCGAGTALLSWARQRIGSRAGTLRGIADDAALPVARRWGFVTGRRHTMSVVSPRLVAPPTALSGVEVVDLRTVGARRVWECHQATASDDPSGLSRATPYDVFLADDWNSPGHRPDLGRAVLVDDQVVAVTLVTASGGRAWNAFTGTQPRHRGRGLAAVAKRASLVAQAGAGIEFCGTGNDAANAAMLSVNTRIGYRQVATTYEVHGSVS